MVHATVSQPFVIGGWAVDTSAPSGSGVPFLHVWAFPARRSPAIFLGQVDTGGARPDIGACPSPNGRTGPRTERWTRPWTASEFGGPPSRWPP
jgi:hypothetical protein